MKAATPFGAVMAAAAEAEAKDDLTFVGVFTGHHQEVSGFEKTTPATEIPPHG